MAKYIKEIKYKHLKWCHIQLACACDDDLCVGTI